MALCHCARNPNVKVADISCLSVSGPALPSLKRGAVFRELSLPNPEGRFLLQCCYLLHSSPPFKHDSSLSAQLSLQKETRLFTPANLSGKRYVEAPSQLHILQQTAERIDV